MSLKKMKCSFSKDNLLYIDKVECNTGQKWYSTNAMVVISNIKFTLCKNEILIWKKILIKSW